MVRTISSNKSDQELVGKYLSQRDEESFRELYRRHTPALYAMASRLCGSEPDALDAIQECWIRACDSLPAFQWKSSLRTWLIGVLINCVREQTRKLSRHREEELPADWFAANNQSASPTNLEQAIARLPEGYRHVITLHDVEGYTHEEIGALLKISAGTSKSQLHHARSAIRKLFLGSTDNERV